MRHRRQGFTLVELLVAVALIVFVMVILSEAFAASMQSFRLLKAIGDMDSRLRAAATILRSDLAADHFEGKRRLSDPTFWQEGPPQQGFVRVWHGSPPGSAFYAVESNDAAGDGLPSRIAADHILHLTVKKRGNTRGDVFTAKVINGSPLYTLTTNFFGQPADARYQDVPGTFTSQWAEVAYFLRPNGVSANGTPLYTLYRRQLLVLPNNLDAAWNNPVPLVVQNPSPPHTDMAAGHIDFSAKPTAANTIRFNTPDDLTVPERRFGLSNVHNPTARVILGYPNELTANSNYRPYPPLHGNTSAAAGLVVPNSVTDAAVADALRGGDVLLGDVVSFEVRLLLDNNPNFVSLYETGLGMTNIWYDELTEPRVFDTWSGRKDSDDDYSGWNGTTVPAAGQVDRRVPLRARVLALAVTIRLWDFKTEQTRQITIIQDM